MKTRILIADDHPIIREGLITHLSKQSDFEVVAEAITTDEVLKKMVAVPIDLIILDISMPGMKVLDLVKLLRIHYPVVKILILSAYGEKGTVLSLLKAGVNGYLLKDENPTVIPDAVRAVMAGNAWFSSKVATFLLDRIKTRKPDAPPDHLTGKEKEILSLLAEGLTTREITERIGMAERTVEFHISNIFDKFGVNSRAGAVSWAKDHQLI